MNTSPFTGALLLWIVPELIVILLLAACSPLAILNALTPPSTRSVTEGAAYGPLPRQRLDIHVPRAPASVGGYPMVVFFYGGSWNRGERADYRFVGEALAARGILTLIPDYRLYPEIRYPIFLKDSALALAYALTQAAALGGNPQRNTRGLAKRLQAVGVPVSVKLYARVNHLTLIGTLAWSLRWLAPVLDDVAAFVDHSQEKPPGSAA